ncbi:Rne/Rng family ribonuclease [Actinomycetospora soli]|uniref:Rne/Rng family ribonuclease n=1 Tax=Actinomycetospora soli TaxID=2893887 RepID=UPI001E2E62D3|nr:Rne/Rng family ribonuclease [Actinomycetospora soli]MCD2186809.1 Rne/Rng family ribonuclease [Actinomycetospora soli]
MSENDAHPEASSQPADTASGSPGRPDEAALAALPEKLRVHALARLVGSSSREVLALLARLEVAARSAQSSVDRATVSQVVEYFFPSEPPPAEAVADAAEASEATVQPETLPDIPADLTLDDPAADAEPRVTGAITAAPAAPAALFLAPDAATPARGGGDTDEAESGGGRRRRRGSRSAGVVTPGQGEPGEDRATPDESTDEDTSTGSGPAADGTDSESDDDSGRRRRRRGRRGRGRGRGGDEANGDDDATDESEDSEDGEDTDDQDSDDAEDQGDTSSDDSSESGSSRRRRRRRRRGSDDSSDAASSNDDPPNTVTHVREKAEKADKADKADKEPRRSSDDEVKGVKGSTRLEAKRQRRRDGREAGRRRPSILSESEFLARREAVERTMVVRQQADRNQIGVLEDGVLVEHFVAGSGQNSMVGNVYLGRVQNVLPSMEAAFVDIGRGRNAVLYAGEVNWDAAGLDGKQRKIEHALSSGDAVLVQVTKDPVGHKGARLTTQISLPGRFLVYVPGGGATGISRKLPEPERKRLKEILKRIVPDEAGVIIRTAAEGIEEAELEADVRRLAAQWEVIEQTGREAAEGKGKNGKKSGPKAPSLVHEEPDLLIRVVRDMFNEDFSSLVISGEQAWETLEGYISHVAPELVPRLSRHIGPEDVFSAYRIDEQLMKALDRKVWLPSGGTLVIDRTEAMTVVDVNTGKFTGSGGNLEETVTRNNLEAAEEVVRQLRLRDIGGMIVIDFIDMVLESNRDLVLRRLTECLGRDRTRHQVAEVTSLGLVQMTRKRVGQGLLDEFSTVCEHCKGRGVIVQTEPVTGVSGTGHTHESTKAAAAPAPEAGTSNGSAGANGSNGSGSGRRRGRGRRGASSEGGTPNTVVASANGHEGPVPSPADVAARRSSAADDAEEPEVELEAELAEESTGSVEETTGTTTAVTPDAEATAEDADAPEVALEADLAEESAATDGTAGDTTDTGGVTVASSAATEDVAEEPEVALEADLAEESTGTPEPAGEAAAGDSERSGEPVEPAEPAGPVGPVVAAGPASEEPDQPEEPFITGRIGAMAPPRPAAAEADASTSSASTVSVASIESDEAAAGGPDGTAPAVGNAEPAPKRQRRRGASRPAGPPVAVGGN